jgi:hypothetical protein
VHVQAFSFRSTTRGRERECVGVELWARQSSLTIEICVSDAVNKCHDCIQYSYCSQSTPSHSRQSGQCAVTELIQRSYPFGVPPAFPRLQAPNPPTPPGPALPFAGLNVLLKLEARAIILMDRVEGSISVVVQ